MCPSVLPALSKRAEILKTLRVNVVAISIDSHQAVNDEPLGRNMDELVRMVESMQ